MGYEKRKCIYPEVRSGAGSSEKSRCNRISCENDVLPAWQQKLLMCSRLTSLEKKIQGKKKGVGKEKRLLTVSCFLKLPSKSITKMHFHVQPLTVSY